MQLFKVTANALGNTVYALGQATQDTASLDSELIELRQDTGKALAILGIPSENLLPMFHTELQHLWQSLNAMPHRLGWPLNRSQVPPFQHLYTIEKAMCLALHPLAKLKFRHVLYLNRAHPRHRACRWGPR